MSISGPPVYRNVQRHALRKPSNRSNSGPGRRTGFKLGRWQALDRS